MITDYFVKWKSYGPESNSLVQENNMDANKLIKEFLAECIDMVITNHSQSTIVLNARHKDGKNAGSQDEWQYLIKPPDLAIEYWYYKKDIPELVHLIDKYWEENKK